MPNLGPFKPFLFNFYIGNNENPPITDEICWSLDVRYCGASLYAIQKSQYKAVFWSPLKRAFAGFNCIIIRGHMDKSNLTRSCTHQAANAESFSSPYLAIRLHASFSGPDSWRKQEIQRPTMVENGKKHNQNSHLIIHFPTSEGMSEVSEWCERTSERTSEWPSTSVCILGCYRP